MPPKRPAAGRSKTKAQHAPPARMRTLEELVAKPEDDFWPEIVSWINGSNKLILGAAAAAESEKKKENEGAKAAEEKDDLDGLFGGDSDDDEETKKKADAAKKSAAAKAKSGSGGSGSGSSSNSGVLDPKAAALPGHVIVPLPTPKRGADSLLALQVTTRSPMGAVTYNCSKIKLYGGWLTIVGAGCGGGAMSYSIGEWSAYCAAHLGLPPGLVLVAYDCMGGFYLLNGGALPQHVPVGQICYLPPDSAPSSDDSEIYMSFDMSYSDFLYEFALQPARVADFYSDFYFDGWQEALAEVQTQNKKKATVAVNKDKEEEMREKAEAAAAKGGEGSAEKTKDEEAVDPIVSKYFEDLAFEFFPCLFASDLPIKDRTRKAVSIEELFRQRCINLGLGPEGNKGIDNE